MGKIIEINSINDQFAHLVCEMRNVRKHGYDVLNLIEIKKKKPAYKSEITILGNKLRY